MKILDKLIGFLKKNNSKTAPLLIIRKESDEADIKEYKSIDEAISDLENDPNVSADIVEKLKLSFKNLRNKTSIKIKNGEILK